MNPTASEPRYYSRFSLPQRYLHGVLVTTFLGLALTGLPLRFSSDGWARAFAETVGGFGAILFFHKFFGLTLTVAFLIHLGNILYRVIARKEYGLLWGPNSMVPRWKDITDLLGNFRYFFWLGPQPKFDRYTYWDKMDYWAVFWGMAIIGLSGFAMWFAPFFALHSRLVAQYRPAHSRRRGHSGGVVHFHHPLFQHAPQAAELPHGHHHLHRNSNRGRSERKAPGRI
jgi:cytochrome b subunit of formate dehydrogenase